MNFFFALNLNNFNNLITIPKFTNEGMKLKGISLFSAKIIKDKWLIRKQNYKEDTNFIYLDVLPENLDDIFFLNHCSFCDNKQEILVKELKLFYDIKSHYTFRANLNIMNAEHGSSSYQSEYPFEMTNKKGSILSAVSSLINEENSNIIAFKQIYYLPIKKPFKIFLVDLKRKEILSKATFYTNSTNIINLSGIKNFKNCCFYSDGFLGIPIFISYGNYYKIDDPNDHHNVIFNKIDKKIFVINKLKI